MNYPKNPRVDVLLNQPSRWEKEYHELRSYALACELSETVKWGWPCYCDEDKNIVLIHGFKDYCAVLFFKGSMIQDDQNLLIQQTPNVQIGRQLRFTSLDQIKSMETTIKTYLHKAIEVERSGREVDYKKHEAYQSPDELLEKFNEMPSLKNAFEALTLGRQHAYLLYFSKAKQPTTRRLRIEKSIDLIMDGKGLND